VFHEVPEAISDLATVIGYTYHVSTDLWEALLYGLPCIFEARTPFRQCDVGVSVGKAVVTAHR
jgi:hypothetical protein